MKFLFVNNTLVSEMNGQCTRVNADMSLSLTADVAQCAGFTHDQTTQRVEYTSPTLGPMCLTTASGAAAVGNVWARPLANGDTALVFINAGTSAVDVTCDAACMASLGFGATVTVHDLWEHTTSTVTGPLVAKQLAAAGGVWMIRVEGR
jgi:hypothetical protein